MTEKPVRVLNVNDREIPRYVNEETLRREGFEVVSVASGAAAITAAATEDVDVVLLDVQLPDLDGFEVCRRLKAAPATANAIVLLTSATFVTAENKVAGLDSGADGYLVQPYEVAELHATLRSLLRTRAAERRAQALAQELRSAMDVRDEFLAMLGHELRNPLATITTALHMIEQRRDPEALERYLQILHRQTGSLTRIVDDLLDVARITRGKVSLHREVLDLRDVVDRCLQAAADDVKAARHELVVSRPDEPVLVLGDLVRLEQVACNLVTNSIKYTPKGGQIRVQISAGPSARLDVIDTGIGMAADVCSRVFDVFVQAKQSIDRSRGGLGLGLTVVRQLVELHGGTVSAHSEGEGQGSRFTVDLPLAPEGSALAASSMTQLPRAGGMAVAVIEDNAEGRETLVEVLKLLGHHVEVAADGLAGLELVLRTQPDVALVDIGLPRLDGYEVARQIRQRATAPVQLIAMSGYGRPEDRSRAEQAGFDLHIVKPVSMKLLQRLLGKAYKPRDIVMQGL
ncbi:MAG: response regulator [Kofleriaceae bacterium]